MSNKPKKRAPPDRKQCQAEKPNGVNFMTLGGRFAMVRCKNVPAFIATEKRPGADGQIGSMSLCHDCSLVMLEQMGENYADLKPIRRRKAR